jgi:hypothetical protein
VPSGRRANLGELEATITRRSDTRSSAGMRQGLKQHARSGRKEPFVDG